MTQMQWKDEFSVKVTELDNQHKNLIHLLNSLNDAMTEGRGKQVIGKVLTDLFYYAESHFKTEEKYFESLKYSDSPQHISEHNEFRKKVVDLNNNFESGSLLVTVDLLNFLYSWVEHHILQIDMKYCEFFNSKGLS